MKLGCVCWIWLSFRNHHRNHRYAESMNHRKLSTGVFVCFFFNKKYKREYMAKNIKLFGTSSWSISLSLQIYAIVYVWWKYTLTTNCLCNRTVIKFICWSVCAALAIVKHTLSHAHTNTPYSLDSQLWRHNKRNRKGVKQMKWTNDTAKYIENDVQYINGNC